VAGSGNGVGVTGFGWQFGGGDTNGRGAGGRGQGPPTQIPCQTGNCYTQPQGNQGHHYGIATPTTCTPSEAFSTLKEPGVSAPGAPAAQEGVTTPISLWHITSPNQITQVVDTPNMTITNIALPGHVFQGTVKTQVTPFGSGSLITVAGAGPPGESGFMGVVNDIFGALLFGLRNEMISNGCDAINGLPVNY